MTTPHSSRTSRRALVRAAALIATAGAVPASILAACGQSGASSQPPSTAQQSSAPVATTAPKVELVWWHHWAEEDSKKRVISRFIEDYQKLKPNVTLKIQWWQKADMYPVAKNAFIAGKDFPDIMYGPENAHIEAGWFEDLSNVLDWTQFQPGAKDRSTRTIAGKTGMWDPPIESGSDEIYYNPKIFDKLGIKVPDSRQFTADEFVALAQKIRDGGFDPFAQGAGDRNYPGRFLYQYGFLANLGCDEHKALYSGTSSWNTPGVRAVFDRGAKLPPGKDLPRAAMFAVGAWYSGRAFVPPDKGGQPADFRVSWLKYPTFPSGKGTGLQNGGGGGGGGSVASVGKNKEVAKDVIKTFMNVKYGSIWLGETYVPTELKTDPAQVPQGQYQWYAAEYARTHAGVQYCTLNVTTPPALDLAMTATLNEGLPQNLITVDKAVELLEAGRAAK